MLRTRRAFFDVLGGRFDYSETAALFAARGHEAYVAELQARGRAARRARRCRRASTKSASAATRTRSAPAQRVLDAITKKFPEAGRYPFNSSPADRNLVEAHRRAAQVQARKRHARRRLAGDPEERRPRVHHRQQGPRHRGSDVRKPDRASRSGSNVRSRKSRSTPRFRLDVDGMAAAAPGSGLVFFNNPNNPTATVHGAKTVNDFVARVRKSSPDTVILIDEAYHEYVTDPSYETAIPLALQTPNVLVARTFSKAYGMAGMRIGYAIGTAETIKRLARVQDALQRQRVRRRGGARGARRSGAHRGRSASATPTCASFTVKALQDLGCKPTASEGELPLRQHRASGAGVPRRLREAGRHGRPRLPAVRKDARPDLDRDDGRDEKSRGGVPRPR